MNGLRRAVHAAERIKTELACPWQEMLRFRKLVPASASGSTTGWMGHSGSSASQFKMGKSRPYFNANRLAANSSAADPSPASPR